MCGVRHVTDNVKESQVEHILNELYELRVSLAEITRKVSRIEKVVKAAYPNAVAPREAAVKKDKTATGEKPTMTREEALAYFDRLRDITKGDGTEAGMRSIDSLSIANLIFLAQELGATVSKNKASRRALANEVLGRVRQSIMLREHTPVNTSI
jgi:hypothetical protein